MKKIVIVLVVAVAALTGVAGVRSASLQLPSQEHVEPVDFAVDTDRAVRNLSAAVRYRTMAVDGDAAAYADEFAGFRGFLAETYPLVHSALEREVVAGHTLIYRWAGTHEDLPPVLLMGHMDVVPVEPGTEDAWPHGPFDGVIADGYVWGRGTMDDKPNVIGLLEAAEHMLAEGFRPSRTVYLLFGHDEEVGGDGAAAAAALFAERGIRFEFVLDEGGMILHPEVFGSSAPIALVKTAEKGYLTVELSVRGTGGHSSRPPRETPVGILSRAIVRLEDSPFPARLEGPALDMVSTLAPDMGGAARVAFANRWLLNGMLLRRMSADPSSNASIRTTMAPTMLQASPKDNVLPSRASAIVNFRLLTGDSVAAVLHRVRRIVADDRVHIDVVTAVEPSPASDPASGNYALLGRTIREVAPDVRVSPYLSLGATDSRHFTSLSDDVYGFLPLVADNDALDRIHGTGERIAVADLERIVRFYVQVMRNSAGGVASRDGGDPATAPGRVTRH
ncbi:MAG TPA: M20 family peptidase [Longimicrobiales bacterium]|nr:M20 family peptidase [Longimicrobiales bacterium]